MGHWSDLSGCHMSCASTLNRTCNFFVLCRESWSLHWPCWPAPLFVLVGGNRPTLLWSQQPPDPGPAPSSTTPDLTEAGSPGQPSGVGRKTRCELSLGQAQSRCPAWQHTRNPAGAAVARRGSLHPFHGQPQTASLSLRLVLRLVMPAIVCRTR